MGVGAVILARHGKPALSREVMLTAGEYRDWWARYEEGGLSERQNAPEALLGLVEAVGPVLASTRRRAIESARILVGDKDFSPDDVFIEAPLPPPNFPAWLKLSPRVWGFIARCWWWWLDHHQGEETRREAERRAALAAERLIALAERGENVLLVAHGFFNLMIGRALVARGWRRTLGRGWRYWSVRRFEIAAPSSRVRASPPDSA